jgi:HAD superfamily hydrolase (TIGR01509 family)
MIKAIISDFTGVILLSKKLGGTSLNQELLDLYGSLKDRVDLYVFTALPMKNNKELQQYLQPIFKKIYSASEDGLDKRNSSSYLAIAQDIGLLPEEILYIDDSEENVKTASGANFKTIHYIDNQTVLQRINEFLQL